jgi:hypothetical protein
MSSLKPGATYVYERADGVVYAREMGANPQERFIVGYELGKNYDTPTPDGRPLKDQLAEHQLWPKIHREAQFNPALRDALDCAIMIYNLSKPNE